MTRILFGMGLSPSLRDAALRFLVRDAYAHVPSFRLRLDAHGLTPRMIRGMEDLARLPIVSRDDLLSAPLSESLRSGTRVERCLRARTSGTTGTPLIVHMSPSEAFYRRWLLFRAFAKHAHLSFPFSVSAVGVNTVKLDESQSHPSCTLGLARTVLISRHLSVAEQARRLLASSPQVISGPPSCLELVAHEVQELPRPRSFRPRLIAPRGEVLHAATRALLREVFGCPVADFYSCEEIGNIAWECPAGTGAYHIQEGACQIEILDAQGRPARSGTAGSVVVTNLFNRTMPFLRYNLGDQASLLEVAGNRCACGHHGASLSLLGGRTDEFLILPSGRDVSPRTIVGLVCSAVQHEDDPTQFFLRRFQVHQTAPDQVTVHVVPTPDAPGDLSARIVSSFLGLSQDWSVNVQIADRIESWESGKLPTISSDVPHPSPSTPEGEVPS